MLFEIGIIVLVLLVGVGIWAYLDYRWNSKNLNKRIAKYSILIFICSLLIHSGGFYYNNLTQPNNQHFLISIINIIIRSVKMFAWDFNSEILGPAMNASGVFAAAVFLAFILAQAAIVYFLLVLLNVLIINNVKIAINKKKDHFVIFGDTKYSEYFIDDLKKNKFKYITIITNKETDDIRKKWLAKGVAVINRKINSDVLDQAGIISFNKKTIVVSLLDNDDENLNVGILITNYIKETLSKDSKINDIKDSIKKLNLICSIQYKNIDRAEHFRFAEVLCGKMRFFNKYDLMARDFIINYPITSLLPKECFDFEKAKLKKDVKITNLFVGFGNTNKQMLIKNLCNNQMLDHDYNAIVYDLNVNDKMQEFQNAAKGIFEEFQESKDYFESPSEKYNIKFANLNINSKAFYDEVKSIIQNDTFTQIIISLGSDSANLETALELRQVIKEIDQLDKVEIFSFQKYDNYSLDILKSLNAGYSEKHHIKFIGNEKSIFTYDVLINEKFDDIAKRIAKSYEEANKGKISVSEAWNNLSIFTQESNRLAAYGIRVKLNLLGLDLENSKKQGITEEEYFKHYKITETELDLLNQESTNYKKYYQTYLKENNKFLDIPRNNLARLEHLRWNTVHLVNGWGKLAKSKLRVVRKEIYDENGNIIKVNYNVIRKDESIKKHACITTYEGLDELTEETKKLFEKLDKNDALVVGQDKNDYVMMKCETIKYDYTVMDNLFKKILKDTPYKVVKKY